MAAKVKIQTIRKNINKTAVLKALANMDNAFTKIGFPAEVSPGSASNTGSGHPPYTQLSEVATIAAYNEYGTRTIPPRPAMQTAYAENVEKVRAKLYYYAKRAQLGKISVSDALGNIGEFLTAKTKLKYRDWSEPGNAPATIRAKKGANNPLIDTGQMVNTISHVEVVG